MKKKIGNEEITTGYPSAIRMEKENEKGKRNRRIAIGNTDGTETKIKEKKRHTTEGYVAGI